MNTSADPFPPHQPEFTQELRVVLDYRKLPVAKLRRCFGADALTVICGAFNSGCVPIPVVKSTSLPNVESRLPADLRESGDEVLVRQANVELFDFWGAWCN